MTILHSYFLPEGASDQVCKNLQQAKNYKVGLSDITGNSFSELLFISENRLPSTVKYTVSEVH